MGTMINKGEARMNTPKQQSTLVDLVKLRYTDYGAFMDRLYEALSGEFQGSINDSTPVESKKQALSTMIEYFSEKEEYEKCAELKKISDSLTVN